MIIFIVYNHLTKSKNVKITNYDFQIIIKLFNKLLNYFQIYLEIVVFVKKKLNTKNSGKTTKLYTLQLQF